MKTAAFLLFAVTLNVVIPEGETVTGRCVGVHDGDSMTLLVDLIAAVVAVAIVSLAQ
jgi:hypothetical protein